MVVCGLRFSIITTAHPWELIRSFAIKQPISTSLIVLTIINQVVLHLSEGSTYSKENIPYSKPCISASKKSFYVRYGALNSCKKPLVFLLTKTMQQAVLL